MLSPCRTSHSGLPSFANGTIAVIEAYCDESDSQVHGGQLLVIAGYLADELEWREFIPAWKDQVLDRFRIPYFHAKELRSQNAKLYRHLDFTERARLLNVACELIGKYVRNGAIVYMRPHDWKQSTTATQRSRWGSAYGICMEILVSVVLNELVSTSERVSVFLEEGHNNAGDALLKVRRYKHDTEPIEFPELSGEPIYSNIDHPELKARRNAMRIGDSALVSKISSPPAQAADLLAYLVGSALNPTHPIFHGVLDTLLTKKPHGLCGWSPQDVKELVAGMAEWEQEKKVLKAQTYEMKKQLRSEGMKVFQMPWGFVVDHNPQADEESVELKNQVNTILEKFKDL